MNVYNQLKQTELYQNSSQIRRVMLAKTNNIQKITHGINMSRNVGFEKWVKTFHPSEDNQKIVEEILTKNPSTIK